MDVIIATLSGFIIAFFAEPVKNYFATKAKLSDLRVALYKELFYNYSTLTEFWKKTKAEEDDKDVDFAGGAFGNYLVRRVLRTECYDDALKNQISLFYKLEEAHMINILQGRILSQLIHLYDDFGKFLGQQQLTFDLTSSFRTISKTYQDSFLILLESRVLDPKILKKVMDSSQYKELLERAKEVTDQPEL